MRVALKNLELKNTYKAFCVLKIKKHHEEHTAALAACVPNDDAAAAKVAEAYKKTEKAVECFEGASGRVRHALCTVRHMGVQPPVMLSVFFLDGEFRTRGIHPRRGGRRASGRRQRRRRRRSAAVLQRSRCRLLHPPPRRRHRVRLLKLAGCRRGAPVAPFVGNKEMQKITLS